MVKIKWTTIFQAVYVLLDHSDVLAVPMVPWNAAGDAPMSHGVSHVNTGLTNRRMMEFKNERLDQELRPLVPPPVQVVTRVYPNEAQDQKIKHAVVNQPMGTRYTVDDIGNLTEEPKDACDPSYFCGKMEFRNTEGQLLHETGCCHCNKAFAGVRPINSAECAMHAAVDCVTTAAIQRAWKYYGDDVKLLCRGCGDLCCPCCNK